MVLGAAITEEGSVDTGKEDQPNRAKFSALTIEKTPN